MNKILENNQVVISGEVVSKFYFSHEYFGEKYYLVYVDVPRTSGFVDRLPVMVSEYLTNVEEDLRGCKVSVYGQYRSYNKHERDKNRLLLSVFALEMEVVKEAFTGSNGNNVYLEGTICKEPIYRVTTHGREITDLMVAVNRAYGKSDYIPCICLGRTARFASDLLIGDKCIVKGRLQSRVYTKKHEDGSIEEKVAYEVSANSVKRGKVDEADV